MLQMDTTPSIFRSIEARSPKKIRPKHKVREIRRRVSRYVLRAPRSLGDNRSIESLLMNATMQSYLLVFLGAGIGGALRHAVNSAFARLLPTNIGMSTLVVNVVGSLLMGLFIGYLASKSGVAQGFRLFVATGVLGGFTTFSAFSLETVLLYENGQLGWAALNVVSSVSLSIAALFAGLILVRHLSA